VTPKSIKVLLIEDNSESAQSISVRLSHETEFHYQVECCGTLQAGLERLKKGNIDVILLDLSLPDSRGLDTFDTLHGLAPNVPTIVLTSFADQTFAIETLRKGACDYLVKGEFDYRMIPRVIHYALERHKITTELSLANARLQSLALIDPLTELLNRRGLQEALSREMQWSQREGSNLLVLHAGLDNFKVVNQTLGHATGDVVLKEISQKLRASLRTTDYIGRIGGDEFLMLLPRTRLPEGLRVAERVRLAISQSPISTVSGNPLVITGSLAIAVVSEGMPSIDELLAKTRLTLHRGKQNGKNKVIFEHSCGDPLSKEDDVIPRIL
jgi:diguanylate cyclase (GGDEF)-like protein